MDNGAIGCGISGSGPSIFALSDSKEKAIAVGNGMVTAFQNVGLDCKLYIAPIHSFPPKILD
jgi:homoserine kinase